MHLVTCNAGRMHLVTHVVPTTANVPNVEQTEAVHQALPWKHLLSGVHLVDVGANAVICIKFSQTHCRLFQERARSVAKLKLTV